MHHYQADDNHGNAVLVIILVDTHMSRVLLSKNVIFLTFFVVVERSEFQMVSIGPGLHSIMWRTRRINSIS